MKFIFIDLPKSVTDSFSKTREKVQKALLKQPKSVSLEQARDQVGRYKKVEKMT
jgi:hypothetical protein